MLVHRVVAAALALTKVSAAANVTWSPCDFYSYPTPGLEAPEVAECTVYKAPLCHPGICEAPKTAKGTIDIFVKRLRASSDPDKAPNVWLLQGGPGYIPELLDVPMGRLYIELDEKVNVYTMDHRGTGRSTQLSCKTKASDSDLAYVPACSQELEEKFGDLSSFSTTSAATDLATFISEYGKYFSTTVYGVDYGSLWVERLMHLNPPEVAGYVLDGVFSTLGASPDKFTYTSSLETGFGDVVDKKIIALCDEDEVCNNRFKKKGLKSTLQHLMTKLDSKPNTSCAKLLKTANIVQDEDPPLFTLCYLLGLLLTDPSLRTLIPPTVYRFLRCAKKDVDVLTHLIKVITSSKVDTLSSFLLDNLIPISEMWETPPPSVSKLRAQFEANLMSSWALYMNVPEYCAYSKEKSSVCNKLKLGNYEVNGIIYERDEYWNKPAKITDQASILLLSSEMDPVVSSKFAEYFFEDLNGKDKELITLKNNAQGSLLNSRTMEPMCGMELLISCVKSKENLAKLERACVKSEMPLPFNWTTLDTEQYNFFSTADVYDGEFDSSLSSQLLGEDSNGNSDSAASA